MEVEIDPETGDVVRVREDEEGCDDDHEESDEA